MKKIEKMAEEMTQAVYAKDIFISPQFEEIRRFYKTGAEDGIRRGIELCINELEKHALTGSAICLAHYLEWLEYEKEEHEED